MVYEKHYKIVYKLYTIKKSKKHYDRLTIKKSKKHYSINEQACFFCKQACYFENKVVFVRQRYIRCH